MLNENIKAIRRSKGLSQQELAVKLNVVRQTVSKWEQGLSVPDADLLLALSEALETPVSTLLGETVTESEADEVKALAEKLEVINLQFARRKALRRSVLHWGFIAVCVGILAVALILAMAGSPYLGWDYSAPETAVMGVAIHAFEWGFVRLAPFVLIAGGRRFPDAEKKRIEATKAPGFLPGAFVGTTVWESPFRHSQRNSSFFLGTLQIFFILPAATAVRIGLMLRA